MSEYLDVMFEKTSDIEGVSRELRQLARAYFLTGNSVMGETLSDMAEVLTKAQEEIDCAVGRELNDRCLASQQSAYNTVAACLAVSALKTEVKS